MCLVGLLVRQGLGGATEARCTSVDRKSAGSSAGRPGSTTSPTSFIAAERAIEIIGHRTVVSGGQI